MENGRIVVVGDTRVGNDIKKLLVQYPGLLARVYAGGLAGISVLHDDWCDRLDGGGPCNCNPDLGVSPVDPPSADDG